MQEREGGCDLVRETHQGVAVAVICFGDDGRSGPTDIQFSIGCLEDGMGILVADGGRGVVIFPRDDDTDDVRKRRVAKFAPAVKFGLQEPGNVIVNGHL